MSNLKERKEQFVTGLQGGTITEINNVTSVAAFAYICLNLLNQISNNGSVSIWLDFSLTWVALLLAMTLYADNIGLLISLILLPVVVSYVYFKILNIKPRIVKPLEKHHYKKDDQKDFKLIKKPFITAYRSFMLILTCLAILAVDFPIFPRRFAKVETWGTSLMDIGVGSFVFSNGLVSARSLLKDKRKPPFSRRLLNSLKSCHTLLILGLLRLYFVKNLEYQEHVTEYGVHWNFFITLSLLPIVLVFIDPITEYIPRFIIGMTMVCVYEWFLVKDDNLITYLILSERDTFFNANREGIFSFIGYCVMFLSGQSTGLYVLGNVPTKNNLYKRSLVTINRKTASRWDGLTTVTPLTGLGISFIFLFFITYMVMELHPQTISRRFANLPYTLWIVTFNLGFLTVFCAIDKYVRDVNSKLETSLSLEAMNSNGLILFLLANVSTGLINMSMNTLDCPTSIALLTLLAYSLFIAGVSIFLYKKKILIRL